MHCNPPVTARVKISQNVDILAEQVYQNVDILAEVYRALNPPVTAMVKISPNVDILAKVYLVHLTLL